MTEDNDMPDQVIRPIVFDIHSRLETHFRAAEQMLAELRNHEDPRIRIAANAEMRHTLELARRTLSVATAAQAMMEFQAAVLDALADAGVAIRREVMGLFEARAADAEPVKPKPKRRRKPTQVNQTPEPETENELE